MKVKLAALIFVAGIPIACIPALLIWHGGRSSSAGSLPKIEEKSSHEDYEIWSSPNVPEVLNPRALALNDATGTYLWWGNGAHAVRQEDIRPKRGSYLQISDTEYKMELAFGQTVVLTRLELDGHPALRIGEELPLSEMLWDGLILLKRKHRNIESPFGYIEESTFERGRIEEVTRELENRKKAEQGVESDAGHAPE